MRQPLRLLLELLPKFSPGTGLVSRSLALGAGEEILPGSTSHHLFHKRGRMVPARMQR